MTVSHLFSNKMAVKMVLFWVSLVLAIIGSNASGELSILHHPPSLKFSGQAEALESNLKEIYSAALGLSVEDNPRWNGMFIADPFSTPEAVVEVYIDGIVSLSEVAGLKAKTYPLRVDEYEPDSFQALQHRINQRYQDKANNVIQINLIDTDKLTAYQSIFGDIQPAKPTKSISYLKYNVEEDYLFLSELETLKALTARVHKIVPDNLIDFYTIRFISLHALSDFHGPDSKQTKEAKKLLGEALKDLSDAFTRAYDGSALVCAVTTDVAHTRRAVRSVLRQGVAGAGNNTTTASQATPFNNAAIFNIILWMGVVFVFSLVAIVYAIMDMDPGRDSIIYRMTSTRMKKDN